MSTWQCKYMTTFLQCSQLASELYDEMKNDPDFRDVMPRTLEKGPFGEPNYCFHLHLPMSKVSDVCELSLSYVPDMVQRTDNNGNRLHLCETALMDCDGNVVFNEDLGYDDLRRFDTMDKVKEEVLRVMRLVQGPVDASDEKEEKEEKKES